jgi:outer membrane protein assembly factor BamA
MYLVTLLKALSTSTAVLITLFWVVGARAEEQQGDLGSASPVSTGLLDAVPDVRQEKSKLKFGSENIVAVPVPVSNPTFGSGLILAGAYYYPQTEEQKKVQPPSFTGAAGIYTDNDSYAFGIMQQNYWNEDRWRFNASAGYADFKLELIEPVPGNDSHQVDWLIEGYFAQASLSRRIQDSSWYVGGLLRYLDITQDFEVDLDLPDYNLQSNIRSPSLGLTLEYDTRDNATNAYNGLRFDSKALVSGMSGHNVSQYESYYLRLRGYHQLNVPVVIAWDVNGCKKSGEIPLWDTCRLELRGFPATRYLSKKSLSAQVEARWKFYKRWGMVAFAGSGIIGSATTDEFEDDVIPSYGLGLRFMVMKSQRINIRVDYARSDETSAWYLGVIEYF